MSLYFSCTININLNLSLTLDDIFLFILIFRCIIINYTNINYIFLQVNSNPYWNNYPNWKPPPFLRRKAYEYRDKYQYFNERPPYSNNYLIPRGRSLEPSKQQGEPEDENITHRQRRDFFKSLEGAM